MIDGILLFFILLLIYSFWWFDFSFFNRNVSKFVKEFKKEIKKNDIIIIFNAGGWGTVPYEKAFDLNPFSDFIKDYLKEKGYKVSIIQYFRTEDHLIGRLGYIKDYILDFKKQSSHISSIIKETEKKIILIGLSNGALLVDEIMEKVKDKENIFSIEIGKPFFGVHSENKNILLIRNPEDRLCNKDFVELFKSLFIFAPLRWLKNLILGEGISFNSSVEIKGHNYILQKHKIKISNFIDEKII